MKTVITYGTFDLFHIGHLNLLRKSRSLGDRLIVGVSTDEFNAIKGKKTVMPFSQRLEVVKAIKYVDMAFAESNWEQKEIDIKTYNANVFAIGDDWTGRFDFLRDKGVEVVYLPRTEGISSTQIKEILKPLSSDKIRDIKAALDAVTSIIDSIS